MRSASDFTDNEREVIRERRHGWEQASCTDLARIFDTTQQAISAITRAGTNPCHPHTGATCPDRAQGKMPASQKARSGFSLQHQTHGAAMSRNCGNAQAASLTRPEIGQPGESFVNMPKIDQFAEHLANGLTLPQIREEMGLNNNQAQSFMSRIRKALGTQAI